MPLSPGKASRKKLHTRRVHADGYIREDGLYEIEGWVEDVKHHEFENRWRGKIPAGEPLHKMAIRMALNEDMRVCEIEAVTDSSPYPHICPTIAPNFQALIGGSLKDGWREAVRDAVGREKGCTHLTELLTGPMTTTAYLTIFLDQKRKLDAAGDKVTEKPGFIDTCVSLQADGEVIQHDYPEFATPPVKSK